MAGLRIEGNTSGNVAEVDTNNQLKVSTSLVETTMGGSFIDSLVDDGTTNGGVRTLRSPWCSGDYRLSVGADVPIFNFAFNGTSQDTGIWKHAFTTMTATQSGGFLNLNANATLTATTWCSMQSWASMPILNGALLLRFIANFTQTPLANQVVEFGTFTATTTTAPVEGAWFQFTNAGLIGVVNYNGTATTTSTFSVNPGVNANHVFDIVVQPERVEFWMDFFIVGQIATPPGNGYPYMTQALPLSMQYRNSGTVSGTPMQARFAAIEANLIDSQISPTSGLLLPIVSGMGTQGTSGNTMGSTALYTNSLAAGAGAAMTNTAASLGTGLGGQFSIQPTLAVGTDGIVCSFQVPAGSINITPKRLVISGIQIQGAITTALTGGPVVYAYSLAYGHTAVSLATAETGSFVTATTKAPRRLALGFESYAAAAAVGVIGLGTTLRLSKDIVVNPGEFVAIVAKNVGVVTTAGVITLLVTFDAAWM